MDLAQLGKGKAADAIRKDLMEKASSKFHLGLNLPMDLVVQLKQVAGETGVSVNKVAAFLLQTGLDRAKAAKKANA